MQIFSCKIYPPLINTVKTIKDTSTVPSTDATPLYGDADQQNGVEKPVLPVAAIGGGIGGLVLLIVVIVLIVVLLQRRRRYILCNRVCFKSYLIYGYNHLT